MLMLLIFLLTFFMKKMKYLLGVNYLNAWMPNYDKRSLLHGHLSWHQALWALHDGDESVMWKIVDDQYHKKIQVVCL